jgi:hypothetical protein
VVRLGHVAGLANAAIDFGSAELTDLGVARLETLAVAVVVLLQLWVVGVRGVVRQVLGERGGEQSLVFEARRAEDVVGGLRVGRGGNRRGCIPWDGSVFAIAGSGRVCDFAILCGGGARWLVCHDDALSLSLCFAGGPAYLVKIVYRIAAAAEKLARSTVILDLGSLAAVEARQEA